jgi:S1-C subfamily serine protease
VKRLIAIATLVLGNIAWFYAMKNYTDMRQVRIVSATLKSTVQLSAIGPIIERVPWVNTKTESGYHYAQIGFDQMNRGTGVFVSNDGLILTCYHVTRHSRFMAVSLNGFEADDLTPKKVRKLFAYVVGVDEKADLALLRVIYPGQWFRGVELRKDAPKGLPVFTIGFPWVFEKHVTAGIISSYTDGYTFTDTVIEHGSSGGGLFDVDGRLVGLADYLAYPAEIEVFQGFAGFTNIADMHRLIDKYEGF